MRVRLELLSLAAGSGMFATAAFAQANTIILQVGPGGHYQTISAAVAAADADADLGNYYDIRVMPGTYKMIFRM